MGSDITDAELDELEALEKSATPGPWDCELAACDVSTPDYGLVACTADGAGYARMGSYRDAAFIAAARNALPRLLAEIRTLRVEAAAAITNAIDRDSYKNRMEHAEAECVRLRADLAAARDAHVAYVRQSDVGQIEAQLNRAHAILAGAFPEREAEEHACATIGEMAVCAKGEIERLRAELARRGGGDGG